MLLVFWWVFSSRICACVIYDLWFLFYNSFLSLKKGNFYYLCFKKKIVTTDLKKVLVNSIFFVNKGFEVIGPALISSSRSWFPYDRITYLRAAASATSGNQCSERVTAAKWDPADFITGITNLSFVFILKIKNIDISPIRILVLSLLSNTSWTFFF